jgi:hypothetical protein
MSSETIFSIFTFIFCSGVVYGSLNNRIKNIENLLHKQDNIAERITRLETEIKYLINQIKSSTK